MPSARWKRGRRLSCLTEKPEKRRKRPSNSSFKIHKKKPEIILGFFSYDYGSEYRNNRALISVKIQTGQA